MSKRPSKNYFYYLLLRQLPKTQGLAVLDAASSRFKNRKLFPSAIYVGADLDLPVLKRGLATFQHDSVFAYCCDLSKDLLPTACFDLAISTHTFAHLDLAGRQHFLDQLITALRPGGMLVLNSPKLSHREMRSVLGCLEENFRQVKVCKYRNWLSQFYENVFMPTRDLPSWQFIDLIHRFFRLLLQIAEAACSGLPFGQDHILVIAKNCSRPPLRLEFNPSSYPSHEQVLYPSAAACKAVD